MIQWKPHPAQDAWRYVSLVLVDVEEFINSCLKTREDTGRWSIEKLSQGTEDDASIGLVKRPSTGVCTGTPRNRSSDRSPCNDQGARARGRGALRAQLVLPHGPFAAAHATDRLPSNSASIDNALIVPPDTIKPMRLIVRTGRHIRY